MSKRIPSNIIKRVVKFYFESPKSLDWIADNCGISKTSVFNIIKAKIGEDPDLSLMRYLDINLNKSGIDVRRYACGIRIQILLEEYGVDLETGESIIKTLLTTCYRLKWPPHHAISTLKSFEAQSGLFASSPLEYTRQMTQCKVMLQKHRALVIAEEEKLRNLKQVNLLTSINIGQLSSAGVVANGLDALNEAKLYKKKYFDLLKESSGIRKLAVDTKNLKKLNENLGYTYVNEESVLEKIEEIASHPDEFWFLFDEAVSKIMVDPETYEDPFNPLTINQSSGPVEPGSEPSQKDTFHN